MVQKNRAKFLLALNNESIKGAILLVKAGNHYTYILGGSVKNQIYLPVIFFNILGLKWLGQKNSTDIIFHLVVQQVFVKFKNNYADEQIYYENSFQILLGIKTILFQIIFVLEKI